MKRLLLCLLTLALLTPADARRWVPKIAVGGVSPSYNSSDGAVTGSSSTVNDFSYTFASSTNGILLVGVIGDVTSVVLDPAGSATALTNTGVTAGAIFNGATPTRIYYLLSPPSGSHTIRVTTTSTFEGRSTYVIADNVNQSTPFRTITSANSTIGGSGLSTLTSSAFNSASGDLIVDFLGTYDPGSPYTVGSGQTQRSAAGYISGYIGGFHCSTKVGTGSTDTTTWNFPSQDSASIIAVSLRP